MSSWRSELKLFPTQLLLNCLWPLHCASGFFEVDLCEFFAGPLSEADAFSAGTLQGPAPRIAGQARGRERVHAGARRRRAAAAAAAAAAAQDNGEDNSEVGYCSTAAQLRTGMKSRD